MIRAVRLAPCLAVVFALLSILPARADSVPPSLFQNLRWRSIGPFRGGRVLAVAGAPDAPNRFYFGAVNGGVWRSDDAGRSWTPIFDQAGVGSIGALAIAPSAPLTLYAGTGEADMRSDIAQGAGMFRSTDGGATWQEAGLRDSQQIGRILVDPRDANTVLVAALGHPYGPNQERGVFRSIDGGRSWTRTLFHDADTGAIDMVFAPNNPDIVYAALWQTRRPPWNVYPPSNGPGSGLYRSTDSGRSWAQLTGHGLPDSAGRIGLAVSAADPQRVYALINGKDAGLYKSDDDGSNWTRVSDDPRITERGWYFSGITADPANADSIYVCDTIILHSADGGKTFVPLKGDPTGDDFHMLWIDPRDSNRRILGVDQGALVSVNGGASWSSWYNQPTGQFYHVSTDNRFPYRVYGAQQDTGAAAVDSRSDNPFDGISMSQFHESAAGGESDNIAPDPDDPDEVYGGRVDKLDLKSNQMRSIDPTLAFPDSYRGTWTLPLAWGPRDHALYFANQRIFRTTDGGLHWRPISPDLTRADAGTPVTLDAPTQADIPHGLPGGGKRRGVVYAIAPSPLNAALIWAGTDDGLVWRSTDAGAHWTNLTPPVLTPWSKIGVIEASHFDKQTAYIAVDRHRLDDSAPYLYRTHDGGKSWMPIIGGLPNGLRASVNVIREDPQRRGLLFAGTESGAFVSFDDGQNWQALQSGLPPTSVRDIVLHGDDLVLATHGRGFYIMDDMSQLRALASDASSGPRLFPPADAIRVHPPEFTGTPMPRDEPLASNPPNGVIIDYALPSGGAKSVEIDIDDHAGQRVRHYSSDDHAPPLDLATLKVAPEWASQASAPAAAIGAHRFVWDLHYDHPQGLSVDGQPAAGVWAPPGVYTITLTVDGVSQRANAIVKPDPRLKLGARDLEQQFDLARRIESARVACASAIKDATALQSALPAQDSRRAYLDILLTPSRIDPATGNPGRPDSLPDLELRLTSLAQAVDGADTAPSPDARTGFDTTLTDLTATLKRWTALQSQSSLR